MSKQQLQSGKREKRRSTAAPKSSAHALPTRTQEPASLVLDRIIHERLRLGILSALAVNNSLTFNDLKNAEARSKDIGMSKGFTLFLGAAELAGGLGVAFGVLTQLAALGLIVVMLGAIQKKISSGIAAFGGRVARAGTTI